MSVTAIVRASAEAAFMPGLPKLYDSPSAFAWRMIGGTAAIGLGVALHAIWGRR